MATVFSFEEKLGATDCGMEFLENSEFQSSTSATYNAICLSGTATDALVYDAFRRHLQETRPRDQYGNPLATIRIASTPVDGVYWEIEARWNAKAETPSVFFDYCYVEAFDGGTESSTVTKSLNTRIFPATGGFVVPQNGLIDVADGVARGVSVIAPFQRFSVRARLRNNASNYRYIAGLSRFQGKTNANEFWGRAPGTVLCETTSFALQGVSDSGSTAAAYWDGRVNFAYRPDEPVEIDGASFEKGGWEAVWSLRRESDEADGTRSIKTICVYAEQVYRRVDFNEMGLPPLNFPN